MISLIESGLTSDQYNALVNASSGATWSLTAHKYNLDFDEVGVDQGRDNDTPDFDAVAYGNYIFRIVGDLLERLDPASGTWASASAYTGLAGSITTDGANLVVDGNDLLVFVANTEGLYQAITSDGGATFSEWSSVAAVANINKIAAVNRNRIHYTVMDIDKNIYNMRVAKYSAGWTSSASNIWYTYPFSNFVAAELPDGSDMIVAATQVPGITTVKLVVNVPTKYIKAQGGLIGFKYSNNWWGDHYDIDVVDELTAYRFRDRIKLTTFSDRVALTCYSSDGTQLYPYTMYRLYTTVDGKYWSKGNALPLPSSFGSSGIKLTRLGDYVYAVEKSRAYKSLMTLALGFSPTVCQVEIPHKRINALQIGEGEMMQGSITVSNEDGWLDTNGIIGKDLRTVLIFDMGYWIDGVRIVVQTHMAEVDTFDSSQSLPRKMVKMTFRDFMAWMTDINNAERPYYWDSQLLGGDNFIDTSNDKYGGLRHIEPASGSFTSENSVLNLTSNNAEGVGFSTFSLYLWNGITQCQFALSTVSNGEYAGIVFRGMDKDNFWHATYVQTDDTIRLAERSGGVGDVKVYSAAKGWASTPETTRWLQVEFRYATIIVRSSSDGITWTDDITYNMAITVPDVTPDLLPIANSNKERGYVGFIGRGYAPPEVDAWPNDPLPYESPEFPPFDPPYYPPYDPNYTPYVPSVYTPGTSGSAGTGLTTTGNPKKVVTVSHYGEVWRSSNLNANAGTCTWEKAFRVPHYVTSYKKDPKKPARRWFGTEEGLYVCENIWAASATATLVATSAAMFNESGCPVYNIVMSEKRPNWMMVQNIYDVVSITDTLGSLWDCIHMENASAATGTVYDAGVEGSKGYWRSGIDVPFGSDGTVCAMIGKFTGGWHFTPHVSTDWGRHFTSYTEVGIGYGGFNQARTYIPYRRLDGSVNKVNATMEVWNFAQDGADGLGVTISKDKMHSEFHDYSFDTSPGLAKYSYGEGGAEYRFNNQTMTQYGDQTVYYNPQTKLSKYMVIRQYGYSNKAVVIWSNDNWVTSEIVNGFDLYSDSVYTNTTYPLHILGYPTNWNFLITAQEGGLGVGGTEGEVRYTPNRGTNWFDLTPPATVVTHADTLKNYSEYSYIAIDVEG